MNAAGEVGQEGCHLNTYLPLLISWEKAENVSGLELLKLEHLSLTVSSPHYHFSASAER